MDRCDRCEVTMTVRRATPKRPYLYSLSGLSTVFLSGIQVYTCPRCRGESPVIPRMAPLHRAIARDVIQKPALLTGEEVRYLRKFTGFPPKDFAEKLGTSPEHLSRIENGKTKHFGAATDKLVRVIAADVLKDQEALRAVLLRDKVERGAGRWRRMFGYRGTEWTARAA
jgi:DNA-binding transcriptional regulator YiaG